MINQLQYHTVLVQFEFGMLYGDPLVCAIRQMRAPVILITQHTIHNVMLEFQHSLAKELHYLADRTIVMTEGMRHAMNTFHGISPSRVIVIPHGIPLMDRPPAADVPKGNGQELSLREQYPNMTLIVSNGLIHTKKGMEFVIRSMPAILRKHPNVMYLIYGTPHPGEY